MARGEQVLHAVFAPTHRPLEVAGQRRGGQFLAVERDLLAEAAADVGRDDRHLRFLEPEPSGKLGAQRMRDLGADVEGQMPAPVVPNGGAAACFDRSVGLAVL